MTDVPGISSASIGGPSREQRFGAPVDFLGQLPDHGQRGDLVPPFQQEIAQRRFERLVDQLIDAEGAEQGIAAQARDQVGFADEQAGLRSAEKLVAAERDQVRAGAAGFPRPAARRFRRRGDRQRSRCRGPRRAGCRARGRGRRARGSRAGQ